MSHIIGKNRTAPNFHKPQVTQVLPEFYATQYPELIKFMEAYYAVEPLDGSPTFEEQIYNLFHVRDISTAELEVLDSLFAEISDGLESDSFHPVQDKRMMARLLSQFYRSKGTEMSVEQFFQAFFNQDVQVIYPKRFIFKLNDKDCDLNNRLKYIQDDRKYQIFSVLLKTGMSLADYETLYKKMLHPAGWYLAAEVETESNAHLNTMAGETTDPLEPPSYPVVLSSAVMDDLQSTYTLLVMEENDPVDARTQAEKDTGEGIIISSLETLDKYENITLQQIVDDFNDSIADWVSVKPPTLDDGTLDLTQDYETLDAGEGGG